jgi:hypothetical protein
MTDATKAAAQRPNPRPDKRVEDPRERAALRAAQLRDHLGEDLDAVFDGGDDFYVPPEDIPDGWSYEWKRNKVYGATDPAYQVQLARTGWEAVPANRHPSYMPEGYRGKTIERKGMILMERPAEITNEIKRAMLRKAQRQMRDKEAQIMGMPAGDKAPDSFTNHNKGNRLTRINKSYEPIPIPEDAA